MDPTYAPNTTISKTWQRTDSLRWLVVVGMGKTLQQAWWCRETGETEWRDIPFSDGQD